jgi:hypothetical protein
MIEGYRKNGFNGRVKRIEDRQKILPKRGYLNV